MGQQASPSASPQGRQAGKQAGTYRAETGQSLLARSHLLRAAGAQEVVQLAPEGRHLSTLLQELALQATDLP